MIFLSILYANWAVAQNGVTPNFTINLNDEVGTTQQKHLDPGESFKVAFNPGTTDSISKIEVAFDINPDDWFAYDASKTYQMKGHQFIKFKITCSKKQTIQEKSTEKTEPKIYTVTFFANATIMGDDTLHNSNFFVGSFVKSIAGNTIPNNELLDLFLKLNFGKSKRFFSLMGVEAGLSAVTKGTNSEPFRINEAMVNMNWAFFGGGGKFNSNIYNDKQNIKLIKKNIGKMEDHLKVEKEKIEKNNDRIKEIEKAIEAKNKQLLDAILKNANANNITESNLDDYAIKRQKIKYWNDTLTRTGFLGAGLKMYNAQSYIGAHFGVMEINGPLLGSYFMAGFYVTPYNTDSTLTAARNVGVNTFRNNIYVEAAINAFGKNVPNFLKTIRLKFGVMMPIGKNVDGKVSNSGDVLSRLAIEVPLGGVFKF